MRRIFILLMLWLLVPAVFRAQCPASTTNFINISTGRNAAGNALIVPGQTDPRWVIAASNTNVNTPNGNTTYVMSQAFSNFDGGWLLPPLTNSWISPYPQGFPNSDIAANWQANALLPTNQGDAYALEYHFCVCEPSPPNPSGFYQIDLVVEADFLGDNYAEIDIFQANSWVSQTGSPVALDDNSTSNYSTPFLNSQQTTTASLIPGNYVVRVSMGNIGDPVGASFTASLQSPEVVLVPNTESSCDTTAFVGGFKFHDINGNGQVDPGDTTLAGWTVNICPVNNPNFIAATATTDAMGYYFFNLNMNTLPPGQYIVHEVQQPGWTPTAPANGQQIITIAGGSTNQIDFLNYLCQLQSVALQTSSGPFCEGSVKTFCATPTPSPGQYTYNWNVNGNGFTAGPCINVNMVAPSTSVNVTVSENAFPGCSVTNGTIILVNTLPQVSICGNINICGGLTQTYTPCIPGFQTTYVWTVIPDPCSGQGGYQIIGQNATVTWPPSGGTISVVATRSGCSASAQLVVPPCCNMQLTIPPDQVCLNACDGEAEVSISGGFAPYAYNWSSGPTSSQISGLCAGTYTVTVTDAACCAAVQSVTINSVGSQQATISHSLGSTPTMDLGRRIYLFDVNVDGELDLISTNANTGNAALMIRPGLPNGTFGAPVALPFATNFSVEALAFEDVDNSGTKDLILHSWNEVRVILNTSIGAAFLLGTPAVYPTPNGGYAGGFELARLDNNNSYDIVVLNGLTDEVYVMYNNGFGAFPLANVTTLSGPSAISYWELKLFDMDSNGEDDIVFGSGGGTNNVHVFYNNGGFTNANTAFYNTGTSEWPRGIHIADMNVNNDPDLVVAMQTTSEVLINFDITNLNPNWVSLPTGGQPVGIDVADLDNDQDMDLLVAVHFPTTYIRVFMNDGAGGFGSFIDYPTPNRCMDVIAGDLNGDCCIDFVTANEFAGSSSVYLNACADAVFTVNGAVYCESNCQPGQPLVNATVQLQDQSSNTSYYVTTDINGMYSLTLPAPASLYTVSLPAGNYATGCGSGPIASYNPNNGPIPDILVEETCHIGVSLTGAFSGDPNVSCPFTSTPCDSVVWEYCVEFVNDGCDDVLVNEFMVDLPPGVTVLSLPNLVDCATLIPVSTTQSQVLGTVSWTQTGGYLMPAGACHKACFTVQFNSPLTLPVVATASADYLCGSDSTSSSNGVVYNDTCSCDPNLKTVYPAGCGDLGAVGIEELTYTVQFTNIGLSPAFNIEVIDQLDANLDLSSFTFAGSSHAVSATSVSASGLLTVNYSGIGLVPGASGWFKYKVTPLSSIPNLTTVSNMADIYFDSNPPVATNTVSRLIVTQPLIGEVDIPCGVVYLGYAPAECIALTALASGGMAPYTYQWSTGSTAATITACPTLTASYTVTITDAAGCSVVAGSTVHVEDVSCGDKGRKVLVCREDPETGELIVKCITQDAVPSYLQQGYQLGSCANDPCATSKRSGTSFASSSLTMNAFEVFPNPAHDLVTVRVSGLKDRSGSIQLTNMLGETLVSQTLSVNESGDGNATLSISDLPAGMYIVRLTTPYLDVQETVIKQ